MTFSLSKGALFIPANTAIKLLKLLKVLKIEASLINCNKTLALVFGFLCDRTVLQTLGSKKYDVDFSTIKYHREIELKC